MFVDFGIVLLGVEARLILEQVFDSLKAFGVSEAVFKFTTAGLLRIL